MIISDPKRIARLNAEMDEVLKNYNRCKLCGIRFVGLPPLSHTCKLCEKEIKKAKENPATLHSFIKRVWSKPTERN